MEGWEEQVLELKGTRHCLDAPGVIHCITPSESLLMSIAQSLLEGQKDWYWARPGVNEHTDLPNGVECKATL